MPDTFCDLIFVLGPTACGKTRFAAELAARIDGEIISADSRQVYRRMNIGTGKDYKDYIVNGRVIPSHLTDICEPGEKYNVFEFQKDFLEVFTRLKKRNKMPIVCGGTGLYIEAVTNAYKLMPVPPDEKLRKTLEEKTLDELTAMLAGYKTLHNKTDIDTKKRAVRAIEIEEFYKKNPANPKPFPELKSLLIGLTFERETIKRRITQRLYQRLKEGMIEEVEALLNDGINPEDLIYYGLEYKYVTLFLTGRLGYDEMVNKLNIAIHQFSKRQMTWFRKMEREGAVIHWLDGNLDLEPKLNKVLELAGISA
ncbi:MAG: tRNA (adenosine(37)-N6)-dimethylallyltransferase MiaA [Bacteroidales bacterium]|nr:tRNA (adenosine(37)-N6)-dimethylallyltransferase MiaA [Bacteroidales bacterium]